MDKTTIEKVKEALFADLMTNGNGDKASRLALELPDKRDGGGYCAAAVKSIIDRNLSILAAEPDPCESCKFYEGCEHTFEHKPYASQVADNRAEELRAQVETLREFVAEAVEWSEAYPPDLWPEPTPNQVDTVCHSLGFSIDRIAAMVLRGYTIRWSNKARALLSATEPKPVELDDSYLPIEPEKGAPLYRLTVVATEPKP